jgi:APA family basic amino acid/polyamine antiporter
MIVVANMVGAGVFTSLGFQVLGLSSGYSIIWLWLVGGIVSLFGAGCYAEIATRLKGSGGEYNFLSQIYSKPIGFSAGWISFTVGFSAPVAAACIALGTYFSHSLRISNVSLAGTEIQISKVIAVFALLLLTILQLVSKRIGAIFQNITTTFKIAIVLSICIIGFFFLDRKVIAETFGGGIKFNELTSGPFFVSLFFVSYAYSGWNASAYITGEIENPKRNIPRSLIAGTLIVTILYVLLNLSFMLVLPFDEIRGKEDVGRIFAEKIFGVVIGGSVGIVISVLLISSISSMIITGPRVTKSMGENYALFKWFSKSTISDVPQRAILVQSLISLLFIITSGFESVIVFIGFTLNIFTLLTVMGLFILRARDKKQPSSDENYRVFGYPFVPIVFILIYLFILGYGLLRKPLESGVGLGFALLGVLIYFIGPKDKLPKHEEVR